MAVTLVAPASRHDQRVRPKPQAGAVMEEAVNDVEALIPTSTREAADSETVPAPERRAFPAAAVPAIRSFA